MVYTGPVIYLGLTRSKIFGTIFLDNLFMFHLDSIPEVYFANFFEVTYEIDKNSTTKSHSSVHFKN